MQTDFKELISYSHKLKVLFIEDNEEVRMQLLKLLENFFSDIQIECDGLNAYENYIKNPNKYELIITDLSMPKLDGIELSKRIMEKNPNQLIVVISAHTESEKLLKLINIGIYKFLKKPVDYKDLVSTLSSIVYKIKREKIYHELENRIECIENDNEELSKLASTDKLTSLYNRHFIDTVLNQKFNNKQKKEFSIIFIDIDNFKNINDTYGHLTGDKILIEFSNILKNNIRKNDILGRWGGEEFIIILDKTTIHTTKDIAEKLREAIELSNFREIGNLTASFGLSTYEENDTINSLVQKADFSLYKAKQNGKNSICFIKNLNEY